MIARRIAITAYAMIIVIRFAMLIVIVIARANSVAAIPVPDAIWMPDHPLPDSAETCFSSYMWPLTYCSDPSGAISVQYHQYRHVIQRTIEFMHGTTIGQAVNAWGEPTGATYSLYSVEVDWSDRYVVVYDQHFNPDSLIFYVAFDESLSPVGVGRWVGFSTR